MVEEQFSATFAQGFFGGALVVLSLIVGFGAWVMNSGIAGFFAFLLFVSGFYLQHPLYFDCYRQFNPEAEEAESPEGEDLLVAPPRGWG